MSISMGELQCGQVAEVLSVKVSNQSFARRLADMGLFSGVEIRCILKSGGASCFHICGALIALRDSELNNVLVALVE